MVVVVRITVGPSSTTSGGAAAAAATTTRTRTRTAACTSVRSFVRSFVPVHLTGEMVHGDSRHMHYCAYSYSPTAIIPPPPRRNPLLLLVHLEFNRGRV